MIIVDDEIDTGGSITQAAEVCLQHGATEVYATCVHPVFSGPAIERLQKSPIKEIVVTDSIGLPPEKRIDKITLVNSGGSDSSGIEKVTKGVTDVIGQMPGVVQMLSGINLTDLVKQVPGIQNGKAPQPVAAE